MAIGRLTKEWRERNGIAEPDTTLRPEMAARPFTCPICLNEGDKVADHDHETGLSRDWLCRKCNAGLGFFLDNPYVMRRAAAYVEYHKDHPVEHIDMMREEVTLRQKQRRAAKRLAEIA